MWVYRIRISTMPPIVIRCDTCNRRQRLTFRRDESQSEDRLAWTAHPARERPVAAVAVAGAILALALLSGLVIGPVGGVVAAVVLAASLHRFFLPSRFSIDTEGVTAENRFSRRRIAWEEVRRFGHDRLGGYLATRRHEPRLGPRRGIHLLFGTSREDVLRLIRQRLAENGGAA